MLNNHREVDHEDGLKTIGYI
uniref:Uncharacterized protein n=1 Tax=Anguilla anguilla TaxID=7936 RepID=A0A0E9XZP4_ANGAN